MIPSFTRRALLARSGAAACCSALGLASLALPARARDAAFPSQPVRLIVPTPPGAGMDAVTRLVAEKLSRTWGQPVVVDNKPGGNSLVGYNAFKAAKGDPHTLFIADAGFISIQPNVPAPEEIEPRKVLRPVTDLFYTGFVMLARPDRFRSLQALLEAARERPGALNYGASGIASGQRLSVELLKAQAHRDLTFVPYAGNAQALTALLAGEVDLVSIGLPPAKPHIEAGRLAALAVTTSMRSTLLPQVPTVAEAAGLKGYVSETWVGLFGPPSLPDAVAAAVQRDVAAALKSPELLAFYRANDYRTGGAPGNVFAQHAEGDREMYRTLVADLKLSLH